MSDSNKTKAQLVNELAQLRQRVAELESLTAKSKQNGVEQTEPSMPERKRTNSNQVELIRVLHDVGNILSKSLNFAAVLDNTLDQLGRFVVHDAACIMLIDSEQARIFRWQGYGWFEVEDSISSFTFDIKQVPFLSKVTSAGQPLLISAVKEGEHWSHKLGDQWIRSHICAPIIIEGQIIGFVNVDSHEAGFYTQADAERLQFFVDQAAIALRNAQAYDRTRQDSAQRLAVLKKERNFASAILNTADALMMVLNPRGRLLRLNRACEQTTGYALDEIRGKFFWDIFIPPNELSRVKSTFEKLSANCPSNAYECHWLTKNNRKRIIAWSNTVLLDDRRNVEYVVSTGTDITERIKLEDRLAAIHQLGRELNLLRDETAICRIALDTVSFLLHIKSSGYGVVNRNTGNLEYAYYPRRGVPQTISLILPLDSDKRLDILRARGVSQHGSEDLDALSLEDTHPSLAISIENPDSSWLTAPMKVRDRVIGVIDVESQPPHLFTANDQRLLQTLADQTAVALENAHLYRLTQQRVDELTTLTMISQAITSTLNLEETLTMITDHTIRLLDADAASVVLDDEARGELWFHAASGGVSDFVRGRRLPAGQGIVGWVIQQGEPALVTDVSKDPRFFDKFDQQSGFKTQSVLCVPLQTGLKTTGAIEVMNKNTGTFTDEDLRLLTWLATPACIAIENARLFEAEHAAREQAENLREATATLTSSLDLDKVLNEILVHLEQVVPYDVAFVFLHKADGWLHIVAQKGQPVEEYGEEKIVGYRYPTDNAVYQEIRNTAHPVILDDAQNDVRFKTWRNTNLVRGWMGVPLIVQNNVIGCLTLNSQEVGAYEKLEASLAQAFANQAAVAIQNAQLFKQVRDGRNQLQSLSRRLVEVQETERRHIARELHDEAGQALTSLMVGLRLLEGEKDNPDVIAARAAELRQITNDVSENLHRLAIDLRPASLDYLGLVAALRQYVEGFTRQHDIAMHFEAVGFDDERLPSAVETNLYRIVQEALTNVVRHAQATRVDIFLENRNNQVITIVEDNGVGFDLEEAKRRSRLGILGIRERTEMLNGTLNVESTLGTGTTIHVEVPYDDSNSDS